MASEAEVVDYLSGLDPQRLQELVRASTEKRLATDSAPAAVAKTLPSLDWQDDTGEPAWEGCFCCSPDLTAEILPGRFPKCCAKDPFKKTFTVDMAKLEEEVPDLTEDVMHAATAALQAALQDGNAEGAQKAFAAADLSLLGETGWSCMHWMAHAACSGQTAADDCGQVGMGDCCTPAPASADVRTLVQGMLKTPKVQQCVDARDGNNATALMFAADAGDREVCQWLLEARADPSLADDDGDAAAVWAKQKGHTDLVALLRRRRNHN